MPIINVQPILNLWRASRPGLLAMLLLMTTGVAQTPSPKTHLDWAKVLVRELRAEDTSYQHKGGAINWKGERGAQQYESHTDCSGFLNALLEHAYGFTPDYLSKWLKSRRPLAIDYHDAIEAQRGFSRIERIDDVKPGDVIAIRYPPDAENSGHILLVAESPQRRRPSRPEIDGTEQWEVSVIDSSHSGHGKLDTRHRDDGTFGEGVGQGVFRIYTSRNGRIVGYTWSTFANSDYYDQETRHLVIGRLNLQFKP